MSRESSTNSEMIRLSPKSSFGGTVCIKWGECSAMAWCQSPWRGQGCIARKEPHPGKIWLHLNLYWFMFTKVRIRRKPRNQSGYPCCFMSRTWSYIMFQCALGWCPPLRSYQGSSKSSNTKSCGCRLVGDEQGHPGDQGRCDWPEFCYKTWPIQVSQSAKSAY